MDHHRTWTVSVMTLALCVLATNVTAATFPLTYLVEEKPFKKGITADDLLTLSLYDNAACVGTPLATEPVLVGLISATERIKPLKIKGESEKRPGLARLHFEITAGLSTASDLFLEVTDTSGAVVPYPASCQAQEPNSVPQATTHVGAVAFLASDQDIPNAMDTALRFTAETYDTDAIHDTVTANSRFTAPQAGRYLVFLSVGWEADSVGLRRIQMKRNSAFSIAFQDVKGSITGSSLQSQHLSTVVELEAGDWVEAIIAHTAGTTLKAFGIVDEYTHMGMVLLP